MLGVFSPLADNMDTFSQCVGCVGFTYEENNNQIKNRFFTHQIYV